ncbi:hypothetical protein [Pseudorhodoferax sp.]|uniref:hypothetical protein n=1 Tax=Pseudorhodoferax sp. TaxID=1993553 RepID=UPI002DD66C85|nr:hypothetical protein [Pseudorhodoferax sp.]
MDTELTLDTAYLVALVEPALPEATRMQAELRYCRELERRLGTPDDVAHALRAIARVAALEDEPGAEAQTLLVQWRLANHAARQQALQDLPQAAAQARFEVRLG